MKNVVIVYKGKYGATAQYAIWLGQLLQAPVYEQDEINDVRLNEFDVVVAGGSVYVGKVQIAEWINRKRNILLNKKLFLFVVCATPPESTVEQYTMLMKNIDEPLLRQTSVFFLKGKLTKKNLSFRDNLILRLGAAMQKKKEDRKRMLTDFNEVKKDNLKKLVEFIRSVTSINRAV
jgi:menaquinone-dependent protoporphyrinogen IX oxidase